MALFRRKPPPPPPTPPAPVDVALGYHQRSKHDYQRFASSLGFLDWANQPDPYRRYVGAERTALARPADDDTPTWGALHTPGAVPARALDADGLSRLLYFAMALSAHKRAGESRWSLRVNPSSGNLHPTECSLVLPGCMGLGAAGVWHYAPDEHALERRAQLADDGWTRLAADLPDGSALLVLSSVIWREAWKYGERAWRYCQHDVGHAMAALRYAAACNGWTLSALPDVPDADVAALAGLDRLAYADGDDGPDDQLPHTERELPDVVLLLRSDGQPVDPRTSLPGAELRAALDAATWTGEPNRLSEEHHPWPVLDVVHDACTRASTEEPFAHEPASPAAASGTSPVAGSADTPAGTLIRARRSAVAMDGRTHISRAAFVDMLAATVPALAPMPCDVLGAPARVHLALFVHRVDDVPPGLYLLVREPSALPRLRDALRDGFEWQRPDGIPDDLSLHRLLARSVSGPAAQLSCGQDIAGDGAFSLGMLAELEPSLRRWGAPVYRNLFWETGAIGQVLYLQAEAAGVRATGIGCFFDDPVHQLLGLRDLAFQSLYHFTAGGAVDDERLSTEPAYAD